MSDAGPSSPPRETFATRLGTLLVMVGVAAGLGNVWRFPYMVGSHGGGAFVLVYLVLVFLFGVPCLMAEWTLGRASRRGPLGAFARAGMPWGDAIGAVLTGSLLFALAYYTVVVAWVAWFLIGSVRGTVLEGAPGEQFAALQESPVLVLAMTAGLVGAMAGVLALGVRRGIERTSRYAMPLLAALLAILLLRVLTLPGAWSAAVTSLQPRFEDLGPTTFLAAMGQVFFSLSLGGTFFLIYGSYLPADHDIPRNGAATAAADTGVALLAVFIVLPAAAVFGIPADQGPPLLFVTLPAIFQRMAGGAFFAVVFFLALLVAAFLSSLAGMEVLAGGLADRLGWGRGRALGWVSAGIVVLAIPAALSAGYLEWADLLFGSTMQPVGSLLSVIALVWFIGRSRALEEVNRGSGIRVPGLWIAWLRYVVPALIGAILVWGWVEAVA